MQSIVHPFMDSAAAAFHEQSTRLTAPSCNCNMGSSTSPAGAPPPPNSMLPPHDRLAIARYLFNQQLLTPQVHLIHASTHALLLLVNHLHLRAGF